VQVFHDFLGMYPDFTPKHAKKYATIGDVIGEAVTRYAAEVRDGAFPTDKESFKMDESALEELRQAPYGGVRP
jgi:3-methyl-2-oxobutanoate hydroxymethyltransferase